MHRRTVQVVNSVAQRVLGTGVLLYGIYLVVHAIQYAIRYSDRLVYTASDVLRAVTYPLMFLCFGSAWLLPPHWMKARISLWFIGLVIVVVWFVAIFGVMQQMAF